MRLFLYKLTICVFLFIIVDYSVGCLFDKVLYNLKRGDTFKLDQAIRSIDADILIFGSSRAAHHYVPSLIEDSLNLNVFNLGFNGQRLDDNILLCNIVLDRYLPKIIILDLTTWGLTGGYEIEHRFLPFYNLNDRIKENLNRKDSFMPYRNLLSLYKFNSLGLSLISQQFGISENTKGYNALYGETKAVLQNIEESKIIDQHKVDYLKALSIRCDTLGVKFLPVFSPLFGKVENCKTIDVVDSLFTVLKVDYYDYTNRNELMYNKYFTDISHLNHDGAVYFTNIFINEVLSEHKL